MIGLGATYLRSAELAAKLEHLPPAIAETARCLMRTTPLTPERAIAKAIRDHAMTDR